MNCFVTLSGSTIYSIPRSSLSCSSMKTHASSSLSQSRRRREPLKGRSQVSGRHLICFSLFFFILAFVDSRYACHDPFVCRYRREPERLTDLVRCRFFFKDIRSILAFVQDIQKRALGQNSVASQAETYEPTGQDVSNVPRIFKTCGLKNRLNHDGNAEETFGFRDLQFNLEVGFQNDKTQDCPLPRVSPSGLGSWYKTSHFAKYRY
jgi:hypothetical protein